MTTINAGEIRSVQTWVWGSIRVEWVRGLPHSIKVWMPTVWSPNEGDIPKLVAVLEQARFEAEEADR
jgi:hypothetical protein